MNGFNSITFNNRRLTDLNVGWRTTSRPTSPQKKIFEFSPSARDGIYDFSRYNTDNRAHYEPIELVGEIMIVKEPTLQATQLKITEVMKFLHSANGQPADLIFDDSPTRIYTATFQDSAPITGYELNKNVIMAVTFKCDPFPRSGVSSRTDYVTNGSKLIGLPVGSFYTKPIFTIKGGFSKVTIKSNALNRQVVYSAVSAPNDTVIIDFTTESVTKNGVYMNEYINGDFWELSPYSPDNNLLEVTVVGYATIETKYNIVEVY